MKLKLALLCTIAIASANSMAACYTVYDRANHVVYNSQTPPVDMSRPLHETVPVAFPGGSMVFNSSSMDCPRQGDAALVTAPAAPTRPSPLLTDRRTADALHLPHTILPSGVALISNPAASGLGVTVVATSSPAPVVVPATLAQRSAQRQDTVITEMHNPPLTIVQQGGLVISER